MISPGTPLLLGSASPRRREILTTLGLPLVVVSVDVDETPIQGEAPAHYLARVTAAKLAAVAQRPEALRAGALLVADTSVLLGDRILGKPEDDADARAMLQALQGTTHEVATRFVLSAPEGPSRAAHAETVTSRVTFRSLDDAAIHAYVATGEGRDKAGAYAIQGIGGFAVARIEGSYSGIVGLPAAEVIAALVRTGLLPSFPLPHRAP